MKILHMFLIIFLILACNTKDKNTETNNSSDMKKEEVKIIGTGTITTITDGYDVKRVNLWSSTTKNRKQVASMVKGEKVRILKDVDPYYLVESLSGDHRRGYCMKGFVVLDK